MKSNSICLLLLIIFSNACLGLDALTFDKKNTLFKAFDKTVPIVTSKHVSWGQNWQWAGISIKADQALKAKERSNDTNYSGKISKLDVAFTLTTKHTDEQMVWIYELNKQLNHPDATGFGIDFKLNINSPTFETPANNPELLPDNQGWRWVLANGKGLEVKFTPKIAKVFFERNQKNNIRAMFFTDVQQGSQQVVMTVTPIGQSIKALANPIYDEGNLDDKDWNRNILALSASPVDLSYLNADHIPAGKHGFVKTVEDQLMFADGTPAKFWGANLQALALFSTSEMDAKRHAKRMSQLGFNLIRIHHHDSPWVRPNIFEKPSDNTLVLSEKSFKKLDWWIKCLKDEGIYVWLDLHVGRVFTKNDHIEHYDELAKRNPKVGGIGFAYYNKSIQERMKAFNEAYLNHINSFTKTAYKDDPAVVTILITNENDISKHYASLFLARNGVPAHTELFNDDVKHFSSQMGFNAKKVMNFWQMGEPKMYLADSEHRFNQTMMSHLKSIGTKSMLVSTSSWGNMGLISLPSLTDSDLIDTHAYAKEKELAFNPRYNPSYLTWIAGAQITGKPLAVSEWNIGSYPTNDRQNVPMYTASIASLQGWDALMLYGYSQEPIGKPQHGSNWTTYSDPSTMGVMPAAALLFRQDHVAPSKTIYELKFNEDNFFFKNQDPSSSKTLRTLLETSRFSVTIPKTKGLPWLKDFASATKTTVINDPNQDFIPAGQNFVESDTGELKRDWNKAIQTINTPKSQAAIGLIGKHTIKLDDVTFELDTKQMVAAVQSLDKNRVKNSKSLFITLVGRSMTNAENKLPFNSEPITGNISITAPKGLRLFPINEQGEKLKSINVAYKSGKYELQLDKNNKYHWFILSERE